MPSSGSGGRGLYKPGAPLSEGPSRVLEPVIRPYLGTLTRSNPNIKVKRVSYAE
jgi:hypothetical protein